MATNYMTVVVILTGHCCQHLWASTGKGARHKASSCKLHLASKSEAASLGSNSKHRSLAKSGARNATPVVVQQLHVFQVLVEVEISRIASFCQDC